MTDKLVELAEQRQDTVAVVTLWRDLLRLDPYDEQVVRRLLRCYHRLGDRNALVRTQHELRDVLRRD